MKTFATSTTVQEQGTILLADVPYAPGTEVDITISPKNKPDDNLIAPDNAWTAARDRMRELFRTVKGFRNSPRIPREELHERGSLR